MDIFTQNRLPDITDLRAISVHCIFRRQVMRVEDIRADNRAMETWSLCP